METVYGHQEGAAVGTNPHKPGRKSYHPLMAFEGQSRLCLNAVLHAGNTHASTDAAAFLRQIFELLGDRPVKYARFDKGFGGEDFYSLWEAKRIGYVGKLKWTQRLQAEVGRCRYWKLRPAHQATRLQSLREIQARLLRIGPSRIPIARFRLEFFHCAAKIIQHSRQVVLKLAKDFANRCVWQRIAAKVAALE